MSNAVETQILSPKGTFPATVVEVIDEFEIVINRGKTHGIKKGETMLVYSLSDDEIKDPETGESLGYLEIVKGTGTVFNVQEKMSTIKSYQKTFYQSDPHYQTITFSISMLRHLPKFVNVSVPFDNPEIGDKVKPI